MEKIIVVIEGPSGVGKDSIVAGLMKKHPNTYVKMPSVNSRPMRENESQGNPYFFVTKAEFENMIKTGEVFEHTTRHNHYRGMCRHLIDQILDTSLIPMKDCDIVGVNALKKAYPDKVFTIFIKADKAEIKRRLMNRGDSAAERKIRLADYDSKMTEEKFFDASVENKNLSETITKIHELIQKKREEAK